MINAELQKVKNNHHRDNNEVERFKAEKNYEEKTIRTKMIQDRNDKKLIAENNRKEKNYYLIKRRIKSSVIDSISLTQTLNFS